MNAGIESTFANHSLIKQLLEPFRLLSRHTPDMGIHNNAHRKDGFESSTLPL